MGAAEIKDGGGELCEAGRKAHPSDILTKAVDGETLGRHMEALGMVYREGRNEHTPEYNPKERVGPKEQEATGRWSEAGQEPQVKPHIQNPRCTGANLDKKHIDEDHH